MKCNVIGAGRLGKNIAFSLSHHQLASIQGVCNQSLASATKVCKAITCGYAIDAIELLPAADITWITSNDDCIKSVVQKLLKNPFLKPGSFVVHCSGVLSSTVLAPLKDKGCQIASLHPLKAFKTGYLSKDAFAKVHCIIEGDAAPCAWLETTFAHLHAKIITLNPESKAKYHAAACMAANYLITLAACSETLLVETGIAPPTAREMLCHLIQGNIDNLAQNKIISESLTGPLMRGDVETIAAHLAAIDNPLILALYKSAGLATLSLTELPNNIKQSLNSILSLSADVSRET